VVINSGTHGIYWGLICHSEQEKAKYNQLLDTRKLTTVTYLHLSLISPQLDTCFAGGQILSHLIPEIMNTLKIRFNIIPPSSPRHLKRPSLPTLSFLYIVSSPQITTTIATQDALLLVHRRNKHSPRQIFLRHSQYMFLFCSHISRFTLVQRNGQNCRLSTAHGVLKVGLTITHWRANTKLYVINSKPPASVNKKS